MHATYADDLDDYDLKIIDTLVMNARISITDLADRVGLSKTPCHQRMKKLMAEGYIRGFRAVLDPHKLGLDHIAYVEVKLSDTREDALRQFNAKVRRIQEIEECHMIAGSFDYLLKVRTTNIQRYRKVLGEQISALPNVASTSTYVVMEAVKDSLF